MKYYLITYSCRSKPRDYLVYETTVTDKTPIEYVMYLCSFADEYYTDYAIVFAMEISAAEYEDFKSKQ